MRRLQSVSYIIPYANQLYIDINGEKCINILCRPDLLERLVTQYLTNIQTYTVIHGDTQLTNTMIDSKNNLFYIDPRGYFRKSKIFGDPRHDWAKLYFSIYGNFDQFNVKNFDLKITDTVFYKVYSNNWEHLLDIFEQKVCKDNLKEIHLIQIIIWLSMAAVAWEDYDSVCVAFYNGLYQLTKWLEKYEKTDSVV